MDRNARLLRSADKFFPKIMSFPDSKVLIAVADIYSLSFHHVIFCFYIAILCLQINLFQYIQSVKCNPFLLNPISRNPGSD